MGQGNGIIPDLQAAMRAEALRHTVIANNIANAETPGFHRRTVVFEQKLAEAIARADGEDHEAVSPEVRTASDPMNENGNNVDVEVEIGAMIRNASAYKVHMRLLSKMYHQLDTAINGI